MPTRAQLLPPESEIIDVDVMDSEYGRSEEQIAFDDFRDESKDDQMGILKIYRIPNADQISNKNAAKLRYLFNVEVDRFSFESLLDYIRDNYGSGTYRVIGTLPGIRGVKLNKIFEVERAEKIDPKGESYGALPGTNSVTEMMDSFNRAIREQQENTANMMREVLQNRMPTDPMQMMASMMTMMGQMKDFFGMGNTQQTSLLDEIEKFGKINELFGNRDGAETNTNDVFAKLIETFAPSVLEAMKDGPLAGAISGQTVRAPGHEIPIIPAPNQATQNVVVGPNATESTINTENPNVTHLKMQCIMIENAARAGTDAKEFADYVVSQTPDEKLNDLYEFIGSETCLYTMEQTHPPLTEFHAWLETLRSEILAQLVPDDHPGGDVVTDTHEAELTGEDTPLPDLSGAENEATIDDIPDTDSDTIESEASDAALSDVSQDAGLPAQENDQPVTSDT